MTRCMVRWWWLVVVAAAAAAVVDVCGVAVEEAEGVVGDRVPHAVRRSGPTCGRASWLRGLGLGLKDLVSSHDITVYHANTVLHKSTPSRSSHLDQL